MRKRKTVLLVLLTIILIAGIGAMIAFTGNDTADQAQTKTKSKASAKSGDDTADSGKEFKPGDRKDPLPIDEALVKVAENNGYILRADKETGHFTLESKKTGETIRSYPDPEAWEDEEDASSWQLNLQSPFMFTYVEMKERNDKVKESNLYDYESVTVDFQEQDNGFKITYEIPDLGFVIPIEVELKEDYVQTKLLADDIQDEKEYDKEDADKDQLARLVSLRTFPFLGADGSDNEDGFIFIPDGSGVLVDFKKNRASTTDLYSERIYGDDLAFSEKTNLSARDPVRMPVFGMKSGQQAVLGIVHAGDAYTNIVSAPSESFSQYNWITGEHLFRFKTYQPTDKQKNEGYYAYSKDMQRTNREIRYYMIDKKDPDYADLAATYRQYLMDEQGVQRQETAGSDLALHLNLFGGGSKEGFIWDSYLPLTTTDQAMEIVQGLNNLGVNDMSITYHGWKKGGYGTYGGHFPVAGQLGGNEGMKDLTAYAHSKGYNLYLDASTYTYNSGGKDSFRPNRDGLRDLSSTVLKYRKNGDETVLVSPRFMKDTIMDNLNDAKDIGIDGILFGDGIGSTLSSDYNKNYLAQRHEVKDIQETILKETKETLGDVQVTAANFYALHEGSHIEQLPNDYSYDLFVDKQVPFAQISLHGLVTYAFDYGNMSGNVQESFLNGIEYGATPSFLVTYEESHELLELKARHKYYSTYYKDWESEIATQYQRFNEALGDVQDQFITGHRQLEKGVFETTYENGKQIIVNYNAVPYSKAGVEVEATDFMILEGGE